MFLFIEFGISSSDYGKYYVSNRPINGEVRSLGNFMLKEIAIFFFTKLGFPNIVGIISIDICELIN